MGNKLSKLVFTFVGEMQKQHDLTHQETILIKKAFRAGYNATTENSQPKKHFVSPTPKLINDMKCLRGIPPYDAASNISRGDGYFAKDLKDRIERAGCSWKEVEDKAKEEGRLHPPSWDR